LKSFTKNMTFMAHFSDQLSIESRRNKSVNFYKETSFQKLDCHNVRRVTGLVELCNVPSFKIVPNHNTDSTR
jgi:hypothetical protein